MEIISAYLSLSDDMHVHIQNVSVLSQKSI